MNDSKIEWSRTEPIFIHIERRFNKMATKGAILKKRIKECGYTQEEFAELSGISLSALKKYMGNKVVYDTDLLLIFSDKLNCSLDYLMGLTETPIKEFQSVKDKTGLSDRSIEYLQNIYDNIDVKANKIMIKTIDAILSDDELLNRILLYLYGDEVPELNALYSMFEQALGGEIVNLNGATISAIIEELAVLKSKL